MFNRKSKQNHRMQHVEHIGIAVKSLSESNSLFSKLLGVQPYKQEGVESEGVLTSFFKQDKQKLSF
jgi:methylmalonyl-CoA/ethylmalonyl-CoA epimerase